MNSKAILKALGMLLVCESLLIIFPLVVAIYFQGTDISAFFFSIIITGLFGVPLSKIKTGKKIMYARDGFAIVSLGWMMVGSILFASTPYT